MNEKAQELSERFLDYAVMIVKICVKLRRTAVGRHVSRQLVAAGTSAGANYEEARGAESRADFLHKLQIVLKELRESLFWLRLVKRSGLLLGPDIDEAIVETRELSSIIGRSIVTAKARKRKSAS